MAIVVLVRKNAIGGGRLNCLRKICVVITARPSYSRVKSILAALKTRAVELQIIACASAVVTRFGRVADQIRADGFNVTAEVSSVVEEDSLANSALSTGVLLTQLAGLFQSLKPDVVVTIADRHETLATAIAASYQNIPLCHIQGGEVTGSIDDKVRNAVTQLADIHCVSTMAAEYWLRAARRPGANIHITGCPSIDLAAQLPPKNPAFSSGIVVLQHPVTTETEQAGRQMKATIRALKSRWPITWFWPGEDAGASAMNKELRLAGIKPVRSMAPERFLSLLASSECVVGNSSVGIRECSFLGVPVVNIGTRQQGRERAANVLDCPHEPEAIYQAVERQRRQKFPPSHLYGDGKAGERIADILTKAVRERAA